MRQAYKDIFKIINGAKTSITRDAANNTNIRDSSNFKGLPVSKTKEIVDILDNDIKAGMISDGIKFSSIADVQAASKRYVVDTAIAMVRDKSQAKKVYDSIYNAGTGVGSGIDPTMQSEISPNIWISPYEAAAMYSQKGVPENIINKKSKSVLLNGLKIKNKMLNAKQLDKVALSMMSLDIPKIISDAVRDSLVYGGSLVFPMFRDDTPISTNINLIGLLNAGILRKNCIDHVVALDRWNTMHLPSTNPTQKDFLTPAKYYIPFLGADVNGARCSRIVTSSQAGYWGMMQTLGWGTSDFCGYAREYHNYKVAEYTLPMMIQQMSVLARTIPMDASLIQEGTNAIEEMMNVSAVKTSEWSMNNPITLDMIGTLSVINRDFAQVPELLRILRQGLCAAATIPEPLLFSSEKGNFSSGDDTEGNMSKQYESVKYIHKDVESQFKNLAKILVINALGTDRDIIKALPFVEIHFDVPVIANSVERAAIGLNLSKAFFENVAGQMPLDKAAQITSSFGGDEMSIDSELLEDLKKRQEEADGRSKEKHDLEMELLQCQIDASKATTKNTEEGVTAPGSGAKPAGVKKEGKEYSKLEQAQHSKTRLPGEKRPEQLAKRQ